MPQNNFTYLLLLLPFFMVSTSCISQIYNTEVEAKINMEANNEFIEITGTAFNKTEVTQSLRYVLSVIKTGGNNSNRSKNDQSGRMVVQPNEKVNLSQTAINTNDDDRIIIMLLIYDMDDNIIGQDRIVLNEGDIDLQELESKATILETLSEDIDQGKEDGLVLRGIVVEDTKTKPGRDFYTHFYSAYNANNINGNQIVTITELLALGTNTKIEVKVGEETVFSFFVRPQDEFLKSMSDAAIRRVYRHFQRLQQNEGTIKRY